MSDEKIIWKDFLALLFWQMIWVFTLNFVYGFIVGFQEAYHKHNMGSHVVTLGHYGSLLIGIIAVAFGTMIYIKRKLKKTNIILSRKNIHELSLFLPILNIVLSIILIPIYIQSELGKSNGLLLYLAYSIGINCLLYIIIFLCINLGIRVFSNFRDEKSSF